MKPQNNYMISPLEMGVTIIAVQTGVAILTLPRVLANSVGTPDGWIAILIGGAIIMTLVYFYTKLQRYFPGQSLFQYIAQGPLGNVITYLLTLLLVIYFMLIVAYVLRIVTVVTKMYLLNQTPAEVITLIFILLITYAVKKQTQGIVHLNLLFVPIILVLLFLLTTFSLPEVKIENLRPVLAEGIHPILTGVKEAIFSVLGIEILFFFMSSMKAKDIKALPLNLSIGVVLLTYIAVTVMSYTVFSFEITKYIMFPTIEIAKQVEIPGGFLERLDSLMLTIWLLAVFNTLSIYHFLAVETIKKYIFKRLSINTIVTILAFLIFILTFLPESAIELFEWTPFISYMGFFLIIFCILYGYFVHWRLNRKSTTPKSNTN
ncbi:GerAB/ArcD/ProY family transporter [Anaerobacillus sp. MEB173]|uniref:GerAB/ArcD/ProY family transporter n=1 Tax=Anaerobacillus sp. MEB173 TaxID=3383345 RepID=UPI003F90D5B2